MTWLVWVLTFLMAFVVYLLVSLWRESDHPADRAFVLLWVMPVWGLIRITAKLYNG